MKLRSVRATRVELAAIAGKTFVLAGTLPTLKRDERGIGLQRSPSISHRSQPAQGGAQGPPHDARPRRDAGGGGPHPSRYNGDQRISRPYDAPINDVRGCGVAMRASRGMRRSRRGSDPATKVGQLSHCSRQRQTPRATRVLRDHC